MNKDNFNSTIYMNDFNFPVYKDKFATLSTRTPGAITKQLPH